VLWYTFLMMQNLFIALPRRVCGNRGKHFYGETTWGIDEWR